MKLGMSKRATLELMRVIQKMYGINNSLGCYNVSKVMSIFKTRIKDIKTDSETVGSNYKVSFYIPNLNQKII